LPQEVGTTQYGCGALRTLQKIKFHKDTLVCMYISLYVLPLERCLVGLVRVKYSTLST